MPPFSMEKLMSNENQEASTKTKASTKEKAVLPDEVEVEFKVIPEQTKKHKDPKLAALGNRTVQSGKFTTGFVGPRQVGQHAVLGFYSEEGDLSHLDLGYCYLSTEALNKGMNRDKKRSISASVINECRESNIIKRYTINRRDYIDKKYKKP